MAIYLLLTLPALGAALWRQRLSQAGLLLLVVSGGLGLSVLMPIGSRDYPIYLRDFADLNAQPYLEVLGRDPLYASAVWIFGHLGGSGEVFYVLLATLALAVKLTALRRLGGGYSMVILLYMSSYFFVHEFTQIRAGLAIGLWMHAIHRLDRSGFQAFVLTALASMIHLQAMLGFVVLALQLVIRSRRSIRLACLAAAAIFLLAATRWFDQIGYALLASIPDPRTEIYLELAAQELWVRPNPFSLISLLAMLTAFAGLLTPRALPAGTHQLPPSQRLVFIALLLGSCALALLSSVSVAAFRVSEHLFALLPLGLWLVASAGGTRPRYRLPLLGMAALLAYIFLFHSPYLLDPDTGEPNE